MAKDKETKIEEQKPVEVEEVKKEASEQIEEQSAAAATLKPNSTKAEMMSKVVSKMAGMSKSDLSNMIDKVLASVGKEADVIPAGTAEKNKASVAANKSVKEDVEEMLGSEELSEELKEKASTLFEAAVNNRVAIEKAQIQEEFDSKVEEAIKEKTEEQQSALVEQVDNYLTYAVNEWMKKNEVAINSTLQAEVMEGFVSGLKTLFKENYIEIPEDKVDVVNELGTKVEELETKLNEAIDKNLQLEKVVEDAEKLAIFDEVSEGLAETQIEKFKTMAEGIESENLEQYKSKLKVIKENYFSEKKVAPKTEEEKVDGVDDAEKVEAIAEESKKAVGPMSNYVNAISRTLKK